MVIHIAGWAGTAEFPVPPQIVANQNQFPTRSDERFTLTFQYAWSQYRGSTNLDPDGTARAWARIRWRTVAGIDLGTTELGLPATAASGGIFGDPIVTVTPVSFEVSAPSAASTGQLEFEGPDCAPEERAGLSMQVYRPDVRRVILTEGSVSESALLDGAVTTPKLADYAVTLEKLAPRSVGLGKIGATRVTDLDSLFEEGPFYGQDITGAPSIGWYAGFQMRMMPDSSDARWFQSVREAKGSTAHVEFRRYWNGSSWGDWVPDKPARGTYNAGTNILAGEFFDQVVTFPAGMFTSTPTVVAGTDQVRVLAAPTSVSTTQATIRVYNVSSGTAGGTCTASWTATQ